MPRKLRIQYPGAIYHVINRGDQREDIFRDDPDRQRFLSTLDQACQKTQWQVHAYCLMRNHFHLVIETPTANSLMPGDVVYAIPTHICPTCAMHQRAYIVEDCTDLSEDQHIECG